MNIDMRLELLLVGTGKGSDEVCPQELKSEIRAICSLLRRARRVPGETATESWPFVAESDGAALGSEAPRQGAVRTEKPDPAFPAFYLFPRHRGGKPPSVALVFYCY